VHKFGNKIECNNMHGERIKKKTTSCVLTCESLLLIRVHRTKQGWITWSHLTHTCSTLPYANNLRNYVNMQLNSIITTSVCATPWL